MTDTNRYNPDIFPIVLTQIGVFIVHSNIGRIAIKYYQNRSLCAAENWFAQQYSYQTNDIAITSEKLTNLHCGVGQLLQSQTSKMLYFF